MPKGQKMLRKLFWCDSLLIAPATKLLRQFAQNLPKENRGVCRRNVTAAKDVAL